MTGSKAEWVEVRPEAVLEHGLSLPAIVAVVLSALGVIILSAGQSAITLKTIISNLVEKPTLIGLTSAGDAHIADRYTLYAIAGVILGGGEFVGGRVSPIGAVLGALTLALTPQLMGFMKISTDWQIGAQGGILIIAMLLGRVGGSRR